MGEELSIRRINRKAEIYKNPKTLVDLYVIYYKNMVIGNVEHLSYGSLVKLEDFNVYEPYQHQRHGSSMIDKARKSGTKGVYLTTHYDETAKYMYEKCGFEFIGQKKELLFYLNVKEF